MKTISPTATGPRPIGPRWQRSNPRRVWRELRSAAWPSHLRYVVGLLAKSAEQSDGGPPQCGNKIYRYPPSGRFCMGTGREPWTGHRRCSSMGLRMKSCWSSIRSCWARGSASLRREPRHAHSSSSARKRWHRASSSTPTGPTDLCGPAPWAHRHSDLRGRTQMRKLIFAINTTLDGCVDHTKQFVDEEKLEYFTHLTREVDLQVFGRKTYQLMVPYWPEVLKNQSATKAYIEFED